MGEAGIGELQGRLTYGVAGDLARPGTTPETTVSDVVHRLIQNGALQGINQVDENLIAGAMTGKLEEALATEAAQRLAAAGAAHIAQQQQLAAAYERSNAALAETINRLKLNDLSPLSPEQRLAEAQRQFDALDARAITGDLDAQAALGGAGSALVQAGRAYHAASPEFVALFDRVTSRLDAVRAHNEQEMIPAARAAIDETTRLLAATSDLGGLTAAGLQAILGGSSHLAADVRAAADALIGAVSSIESRQSVRAIAAAAAALAIPVSDIGFDQAAFNDMQSLTVGGFAEGGVPPVGKYVWVGERGPELARFDAPVRIYSNSDSMGMVGRKAASPLDRLMADGNALTAAAVSELQVISARLLALLGQRAVAGGR
jgi:hypothetical protein